MVKTLDGWRSSGLSLREYLQPGDQVDEAMYNYALNVLPPVYWNYSILQVGEPSCHVDGRPAFPTFKRTSQGYFYCGDCHRGRTQPVR